jgi:hypothetical protein
MRRVATVVSLVMASWLGVPVLPAEAAPATAIYPTVFDGLSPRLAGRPTDLSATLVSDAPTPSGQVLTLWLKQYGASAYVPAGEATTDASGHATIYVTLQRSAAVQWRFAGTADYAPSASTPYVVGISPRVTMRVNDRTLRRGQRFVATGRSYPAKPGCTVKLWRGELRPLVLGPAPVRLEVARVRADGSYRMVHRFKRRARMHITVTISACSGNARGLSPYVAIRVR